MALKVKAKEQFQNIGKYAGQYRYVMMPELYTALTQDKVIKEAALPVRFTRTEKCINQQGLVHFSAFYF